MGYYNVIAPCVVGKRHHVRPTVQPIEVDDTEAAPLVESGCLKPYQPGHAEDVHVAVEGPTKTILDGALGDVVVADLPPVSEGELVEFDDEPPTDPPPPRRPRRRRSED